MRRPTARPSTPDRHRRHRATAVLLLPPSLLAPGDDGLLGVDVPITSAATASASSVDDAPHSPLGARNGVAVDVGCRSRRGNGVASAAGTRPTGAGSAAAPAPAPPAGAGAGAHQRRRQRRRRPRRLRHGRRAGAGPGTRAGGRRRPAPPRSPTSTRRSRSAATRSSVVGDAGSACTPAAPDRHDGRWLARRRRRARHVCGTSVGVAADASSSCAPGGRHRRRRSVRRSSASTSPTCRAGHGLRQQRRRAR